MKKYLKILFEPFFEKKGQYLFHIFVSISLLLISLGSIELIRRLILSIENNAGFENTTLYGVFAAILIIVVFVGKLYFSYLRPHNMVSIQNFLFRKYLNHYILLDNEKVNNYGNGKFINIINSGVISTGEILYLLLFEITVIIVGYIFSIIMIGYINPYLIVPVICITVLLFFAMSYTSEKTFSYRKERKVLREKLSKQTLKILMEKFTILKNGKGKEEVQKIIDINNDTKPVGRKVTFYIRLLEEGAQMIIDAGEIILILILGYFIYQNTSTFADIGALLFIMALIKKNINSLSIYYRQITNMQNDFTRLVDIFEEIQPIKNYETGNDFQFKHGEITIKNLSYKYPDGKEVFDSLSLDIPAKSQVAFIGRSGSGKSTLVKLILAFIEKQDGSILIDNQELGEIALKGYYKHIGYLQQETSVFDGTILENIMYGGDIQCDEEKINLIIEQSACDFIYDLPKGLDTEIGEKGVKLSGGEKQRIAIARLLIQDPDIIILDEPTSALDSFSEDSIKKALKNLTQGKTVITIAHRLQTIVSSDIIFIFDNGKIIDQGNHKELLEKSDTYKRLIDLQNGGVY